MDEKYKKVLRTQAQKLSTPTGTWHFILGFGAADPVFALSRKPVALSTWPRIAAEELGDELPDVTVVLLGRVEIVEKLPRFVVTEQKGSVQLKLATERVQRLATTIGGSVALAGATVVDEKDVKAPVQASSGAASVLAAALTGGSVEQLDLLATPFGGVGGLEAAIGTKDAHIFKPFFADLCDGNPARFKELVTTFGADRLRSLSATWGGIIP